MIIAVQGIKLLAVYYKYQNKIQSVFVLTILSYKWNVAQHYSDIKTIKTFSKK